MILSLLALVAFWIQHWRFYHILKSAHWLFLKFFFFILLTTCVSLFCRSVQISEFPCRYPLRLCLKYNHIIRVVIWTGKNRCYLPCTLESSSSPHIHIQCYDNDTYQPRNLFVCIFVYRCIMYVNINGKESYLSFHVFKKFSSPI